MLNFPDPLLVQVLTETANRGEAIELYRTNRPCPTLKAGIVRSAGDGFSSRDSGMRTRGSRVATTWHRLAIEAECFAASNSLTPSDAFCRA